MAVGLCINMKTVANLRARRHCPSLSTARLVYLLRGMTASRSSQCSQRRYRQIRAISRRGDLTIPASWRSPFPRYPAVGGDAENGETAVMVPPLSLRQDISISPTCIRAWLYQRKSHNRRTMCQRSKPNVGNAPLAWFRQSRERGPQGTPGLAPPITSVVERHSARSDTRRPVSNAYMILPSPTCSNYTNLLTDIERGQVKIPHFQRDFVWTMH